MMEAGEFRMIKVPFLRLVVLPHSYDYLVNSVLPLITLCSLAASVTLFGIYLMSKRNLGRIPDTPHHLIVRDHRD